MIVDRQTIRAFRRVLFDLARVGEIHHRLVRYSYGLTYAKVLLLGKSGWAAITPWGLVATPYLLFCLPVSNEAELIDRLGLPAGDDTDARSQWASLDDFDWCNPNGDSLERWQEVFATLGLTYDYIGVLGDDDGWNLGDRLLGERHAGPPSQTGPLAACVTRPALLYPYVPIGISADEWNLEELNRLPGTFRQRNCHVFSTLGFRSHGEITYGMWANPFYWLAIQLLILSDRETGAPYEIKTRLHMPHRFDDRLSELTAVAVHLGGTPAVDFLDVLDEILPRVNCVWVNREKQPRKAWPQVMSVFRLLYKLGILERQPDGWLGMTGEFRRRLFEKDDDCRERFVESKDAREKIREIIMAMAASHARGGESQQNAEEPA